MIYLSDDYISKYSDVLSYLIARSHDEGYSFDFIQKSISYSIAVNELERSNVTIFAFSSIEKIYSDIFPMHSNDYELDIYGLFGWVGSAYMLLFLKLEITFEALFCLIPIEEMINLYHLYHEMDNVKLIAYAKEKMKHSLLDVIMQRKGLSNKQLSIKTELSVSTINAIRYGNRDINKLEANKLLKMARALNIKMETLLPDIGLIMQQE